jgi:multiple sugar transport system ATP-binding protein
VSRVVLEGVTKRFDDVVAVQDLTLEARDQEFLVLLGPSGCGKSTALRVIAGLEQPDEGTVRIGDRVVNDVEAKDRDVAMVFQSYALYPHMTVGRNIEFPLRARHVPKDQRDVLVAEAARVVGLADLLARKPGQLSGGQRQRVALARAIVRRPQAFLMDEPLSNLDAKLRVQTRAELMDLHRRFESTVVYVTHDQVEAMTMGDRIAILDHGVLQQLDLPQRVYERPANLFVAGFIGTPPMNTVRGRVTGHGAAVTFEAPGAHVALPDAIAAGMGGGDRRDAVLGVRPEALRVDPAGSFTAKVTLVESLGHERHLVTRLDDGQLLITRQPAQGAAPREGEIVTLAADPEALHLFDPVTEQRVGA